MNSIIRSLHPSLLISARRKQVADLVRRQWQLPSPQGLGKFPLYSVNLHGFATSAPTLHPVEAASKQPKERSPVFFYAIMSLLIGSAALQLLRQRDDFVEFTAETDEKLALLRKVVRQIQNGEDVDVEKALGTGDSTKEREWEQVMEELRAEDNVFKHKRSPKESSKSDSKSKADTSE